MLHFNELIARILGVFRRRETDRRISEETEFHLDMLTSKYAAKGLGPEEARLAARREFGGVARTQEHYREQSRFAWLDTLWADLVFARRSLAKTPTVTALIIVTLGLGIGANTALFSALNELLLRPLPYPEAERLVAIGRDAGGGGLRATSPREFALTRESARTLAAAGTMFMHRGENVETPMGAQHMVTLRLSEGCFRVLEVAPLMGRTFSREEDVRNGPKVAMLSYGLWHEEFAGDRDVVGKTVRIAGVPHVIVGVMPEYFSQRMRARLWLPLQSDGQGYATNYTTIGRLAEGATLAQAAAEMATIFGQVDREILPQVPEALRGKFLAAQRPGTAILLQESERGEFRQPAVLLYCAVCIVLLVACLNVANLCLSRSASRVKEVAIRAALGAGRWRIARQMFTESLLLAALGCATGLVLGRLLIIQVAKLAPDTPLKNVTLDQTTLLFTVTVSLLAGLGFGMAPVVHAFRLRLNEAFKETTGTASAGRSALRGRQVLVISQVALCTLLLAGTGLLVRTILNLRAVDIGFDPRNLMTAPMALNAGKLAQKESLLAYYSQTMDRVRAIPGVKSVAVTTQLPVEGQMNMPVELLDSSDPSRTRNLQLRAQTPEAFRVFGMRMVRGRDFAEGDREGSPAVAVVNEAFAREFSNGRDVLGQRIAMQRLKIADVWTVVGVVNDVREMGLKKPAPPTIYTLVEQLPQPVVSQIHGYVPAKWIIRVQPTPGDIATQVRQAVSPLDPSQPFQNFEWMDAVVARSMRMERLLMGALGAFALLTLLMAASGLYGTLAYAVTQRRPEFGLRMALGAMGWSIAGMVLRSSLGEVVQGLILGMAAAYWGTRLLQGFLFDTPALDPFSLAGAAGVMLLVSVMASLGPSLTAARTDPLRTLRSE